MINNLLKYKRLNETLFLFLLSLMCLSMSTFRITYTGTFKYLFLNWNLFLAFMPWFFSSLLIVRPDFKRKKPVIVLLLFSWLLFFPNAPYLLTDLFHLKYWSNMPKWYDLIMILSYSWTGILFGFLSLWDIENIFKSRINPKLIPYFSSAFLFLGSFGVYLGRFGRWNSWDIIRKPLSLMGDISEDVLNPIDNHQTWGVTIFMGLFLNMIYWSFKLIRSRNIEEYKQQD